MVGLVGVVWIHSTVHAVLDTLARYAMVCFNQYTMQYYKLHQHLHEINNKILENMNFICKKEDFTYVRNGFENTVFV